MNKQKNYKSREEIPEKYKWNFDAIYESWGNWESDFKSVKDQIKDYQKYKGKLDKDVKNLIKLLKFEENLEKKSQFLIQLDWEFRTWL